MNKITERLKRLRISRKTIITWLVPVGLYLAVTLYYLWPALLNCTTTVLDFGDNTAGPIWLHNTSPGAPWWGFTNVTNYPYGEMLGQPVHASAFVQYLVYWVFAKLTGAVCGFNLLNVFGYIVSATMMYAFIRWLTKNYWVALFAGYAVAFTPYFQSKVGGHPGYGFQFALIALLWLMLLHYKGLRLRHGLYLGLAAGGLFYVDPYFSLLGLSIAAPLGIFLLVNSLLESKAKAVKLLKGYAVALAAVILVILPLLLIAVRYSGQINSFVSSSRGTIKADAQIYSSRPYEYFLPPEGSPVIPDKVKDKLNMFSRHGSNAGEYTVGLGYALLAIAAAFVIVVAWERVAHGKRLNKFTLQSLPGGTLALGLVIVGFVAILLSFPPTYGGLKMPSYLVTDITSTWRVFARLYVVVNIVLVVFTSIAFAYMLKQVKSRKIVYGLLALTFVGLAVQYQTYSFKRPVWSYKNEITPFYTYLHNQSDIQQVAEYPLVDPPSSFSSSTFSFQHIGKKQLLNSYLPNSNRREDRNALRDLTAPQTVAALQALGIDAIVVRSVEPLPLIPGLELVKDAPAAEYGIRLYRVLPNASARDMTVIVHDAAIFEEERKVLNVHYRLDQNETLMSKSPVAERTPAAKVCFVVADKRPMTIVLKAPSGKTYTIPAQQGTVVKVPENTVTLTSEGIDIVRLGCDT